MLKSLLAISVLTLAGAGALAQDLTVTSWGGSYAQAQVKTAVKPFMDQTGTKVKMEEYSGGLEQIRKQLQSGPPQWDVVDITTADALRGCKEGLLEKINPDELAPAAGSGTPAKLDYLPGALGPCMAGSTIWSTVFVYNRKHHREAQPQTVADVFDVAKFPGKRGLRKSPEGNLEWALIADGVPLDQVYNVLGTSKGLDQAFKKLDTIKSSIAWWESGAQPLDMLDRGEVSIASAFNGRVYAAAVRENKPYRFMWDGQLLNVEGFGIVKGSKNLAAAKAFVRFATESEVLAAMAPLTAYGPTRLSSATLIDAVTMHLLPTATWYRKRSLWVDTAWWAAHGEQINKRFAAWLTL